jgi:gliding motility-associated-like protein
MKRRILLILVLNLLTGYFRSTAQCTLSASASVITPIACNGGNATVSVTSSGGTAPISGAGSYTVTAGSHTYTVTDAAGCTATASVFVSQPDPIVIMQCGCFRVRCHGDTLHKTIAATGGTPPYTGDIGEFPVSAGTYTYTVTDANGCTATLLDTVTEPDPLTPIVTQGTISCFGGSTTVNISATGGTAPYSGTDTHTLPAGSYSFAIYDSKGCSTNASVLLSAPPQLLAASVAGPVTCAGTATVSVTASGGTPTYIQTGTFSAAPGTHTYDIADANGCSTSTTVYIPNSTPLAATVTAGSISCYGYTTTANIVASGGVAPYTGTGTYTVAAGTTPFTVTDAAGCTHTASVTVTQPPQFTVSAIPTGPIVCHGGVTNITVAATGGTLPYIGAGSYSVTAGTYTYTMTDAKGCAMTASAIVTQPPLLTATAAALPIACNGGNTTVTVVATGGITPYSGTGSFTASAGTHNYTITDNKGCSSSATLSINEPPPLNITATTTGAGCGSDAASGKAHLLVSGGASPYQFAWDAATGGGHADSAINLAGGSYTVIVTDNNTCSKSVQVVIPHGDPSLVLTPAITNLKCHNDNAGIIEMGISGGKPPYNCLWSTGATTSSLEKLTAGNYTVTVTDGAGCKTLTTAQIQQPDALSITLTPSVFPSGYNISAFDMTDGTIACTANGGNPPYTYRWADGSTTKDRQGLPAGTYLIEATDKNGCTITAKADIDGPLPVDIPGGFSPNGDGDNDDYIVHGIDNYPNNELQVFNRWGNLVYSTTHYQNTWNGRNMQGEPLPDGTYYVVLRINGKEITKAASCEIRR